MTSSAAAASSGAQPVHFSQHAPSAAASRVSARGASLFVCSMLRATLGLAAHELQPEMMRRCKTMQFEEEDDGTANAEAAEDRRVQDGESGASAAAALVASSQSHAAIVHSLWKCIHSCLTLEEMQPRALLEAGEILPTTLVSPHSGAAAAGAAAGISSFVAASAPTAPPLAALRASWSRAIAQPDAMRSRAVVTLRSWGCDVPCVQQQQPPDRWNARQCLLVLDWCSERVGLRQRYLRMMAGEHAHGFFHAAPITAAAAVAASSSAHRSARSSSSSLQFTQPLLPPAVYDSAAALGGSGVLDQSDEFRLLQQLLREAEARATAAATPAASGSPAHSSSMCLPSPSPAAAASSFASPALPANAAVAAVESYADRRLSHRAFQCIALLGRLRTKLSKLTAVTAERTRVLAALQNQQRHPALRGKMAATNAGAASPFEIQCAMAGRSSAAAASTHVSLRRWLDDSALSLPPPSSGSSSGSGPQQLQDHWDRSAAVWRAWIESVAAVQRQAEEEEQAAAARGEGDARVASSAAAASATSPIDSARASARGTALPPHLRAASRNAAAGGSGSGSRTVRPSSSSSSSFDAQGNFTDGTTDAPPLPEPSAAFWKALTQPIERASATSAPGAAAASPTDLEWLLRRWLRDPVGSYVLSAQEREELQALAESDAAGETSGGGVVGAGLASARSSSSAAAAAPPVPATLRWSASSACASLSLLADAHRARDAHRRLSYCNLVEQALIEAAAQGRALSSSSSRSASGPRGKPRVPFTVHT